MNREYWCSRHHRGGEERGRWTKIVTHRAERREARTYIKHGRYDSLVKFASF